MSRRFAHLVHAVVTKGRLTLLSSDPRRQPPLGHPSIHSLETVEQS